MIDWSAGTYELTAAQLAPAAERAVAAAGIMPGERALDVACGTGNAAILAAMGGARVVAVDLAERLLEVAAGRARAAGVEVDWRPGDALALPVEDDAFDAVLSVFGVIFAPAEAAVAELVRVAAPGGRIVLVTWTAEGPIAAGSGVLRGAMAGAGALPGPGPVADVAGAAVTDADADPDADADADGAARRAAVDATAAVSAAPADAAGATPADAPADAAEAAASDAPAGAAGAAASDAPAGAAGAAASDASTGAARAAASDAPAAGDAEPVIRDWGDPVHLEVLFAPHGGVVTVERYRHPFEGSSVEAFADEWMDRHPMWLAGREILGTDAYAALRAPLIAKLAEGNEDPDAFRAASVALVAHVQLP